MYNTVRQSLEPGLFSIVQYMLMNFEHKLLRVGLFFIASKLRRVSLR